MKNTSHLVALHEGLSREKTRLALATTSQERELRSVWICQKEREIDAEMKFLGMSEEPLPEMSADDLLTELES